MIIRKTKGEQKLEKILIYKADLTIAKALGLTINEHIAQEITKVAKRRRWKSWYTRYVNNLINEA
jgi:hypothetical protein